MPLRINEEEEKKLKDKIAELNKKVKDSEYAHYDELQKQDRNFTKLKYKIESISSAKIDDIKKSAAKVAEKS